MNHNLCVDLISFLKNYYGINSECLKANRLTHSDIKTLFPFIKRSSYKEIENCFELCCNGEIVLVYDANNYVIPYYNPHKKSFEELEECDNYEEEVPFDFDFDTFDDLSKEELLTIRKKLRYHHEYQGERTITKLIRQKKDEEPSDYKRKKLELVKESYYD